MNTATTSKGYPLGEIDLSDRSNGLAKTILFFSPGLSFVLFGIALAIPATRSATMWMLSENKPVEIATFLILVFASFFGLNLARLLYRRGERLGYVLFYAVFSLGLLFTGLEEIAWGQQFWGFATPGSIAEINMQGETTLHNIKGFHGNTEVFRLLFGIGGLAGVLLTKTSKFPKIGAPIILIGFFGVIAGHAAIDVFDDIVKVPKYMEAATSKLAELIELLIAIAAFLYLYLNSSLLTKNRG